jgi:hypothetical protein
MSVTYTDTELRNLVEEYITMQIKEFTFNGVSSFILYRAIEEERTSNAGLYESNEQAPADCERVNKILKQIVAEHRIIAYDYGYVSIAH